MSRFYAYRLMDSVKVIENVDHGQQTPTSERQARPLARLKPEQQKEAWQKAVDTAPEGKVTAAHVYKIVKGMTEPEQTKGQDQAGDSLYIFLDFLHKGKYHDDA